jgi:AsmA protein
MKIIKYAFYAAIIVAIALVAYIAATFNPNDYKQQVIDLVKKEKNRTLTIDGDISLTYWPKIGANLGKIAISEHQSDKEFASVNSAKVALSVMPLLQKELVVDTIYIDGAKANIVKHADGSTNFDDLLSDSTEEESSEAVKFDVQGINITNTEVNYSDEASGAKYAVSQFNMESGRIALATPVDLKASFHLNANQPTVNADVKVAGNFLANPETQHFIAKGLDAKITGDLLDGKNVDIAALGSVDATLSSSTILVDALKVLASGEFDGAQLNVDLNAPALTVLNDQVSSNKITVALSQVKGNDNFKANLELSDMKGSPSSIQSSGITGDISGIQGKRQIAGTFASPLKGDLEGLIFDLPKLVGNLDITDPALPNGAVKGDFNLGLHADVKNEKVKSNFALNVDSTKLNGDVAVASFKTPAIKFNLNAGTLDLNQLLGASTPSTQPAETPASSYAPDLSALKTLNLDGHVKIDQLIYDKYKLSGLNVGVLANGKKLSLSGLNVKLDDSKIKGNFSISQFDKPLYSFLIDIDTLDANRYISSSEAPATESKTDENAPFDLTALKALNADGSIRIGNFKFDKTKASNIRIDLKAANGVTTVSPLSANLYGGSTNGSVKIDARDVPAFSINQKLNGINIGPLLHDTIHNDMLSGKGSLSLNVTSTGNTLPALKQTLGGKAALNLADGAIKGVDIAGTIRSVKSKANLFKGKSSVDSDTNKKTDFSELTASFNIKDGVATNNDLAMKAPILRLAKGDSRGTIDIGQEKIDYLAKPTVVKSIKGQGGEDLKSLAGFAIPVKVTGTFAAPKFGMDFAAIGKQAAKSKLIDKVAGGKSAAVKDVLKGDIKVETLTGLLGKKSKEGATGDAKTEEKPAEKVLKKLLNF